MNPKEQSQQPLKRSKIVNFLIKIFLGVAFLIVIGFIAHLIWKASGSNEWEQVGNKDGVIVQTLKIKGEFIIKMKATKRMKSKLGAFVATMQDVDGMCTHGCYEAKILDRIDGPNTQIVYTMTRFSMPFPFHDREWVLENKFSQDPHTKEILYKIDAVPYIVPKEKGFVRITHFNNQWRCIPLENGYVDVEWFADMNQGGYVANLFYNLTVPDAMRNSLLEIEEMISNYQDARYDFIKEMDEP
jgi:hypothetical protein